MDVLKMDETRVLSGGTLVRMGAMKAATSLPEVGMKEAWPKNTWLEEKQIQEALEARKLLLKTERIEKSGALSHAEWREDLKLAEVTQKVGGHWQYLGHHVGTQLYLYPEEALFLLEVNCLLLKYGGIKVSFQQAYALLLQGDLTLMKYKVYASLSRLGYRVYRHSPQDENDNENSLDTDETTETTVDGKEDMASDQSKINETESETSSKIAETNEMENQQDEIITSVPEYNYVTDNPRLNEPTEIDLSEVESQSSLSQCAKKSPNKRLKAAKYVENKIHQLRNRKVKPTKLTTELNNKFMEIPDFTKYPEVNMFITPRTFQPVMIFTCRSYNLNIKRMTTVTKAALTNTSPDTMTSTENTSIVNQQQQNQQNQATAVSSNPNPYNDINFFWNDLRFPPPQLPLGPPPMMLMNPPPNLYANLNMNFQTPFVSPQIMYPYPPPPFPPPNVVNNITNNFNTQLRKRSRDASKKQERIECIKHVAFWVKDAIINSKVPVYYIVKLQQLMHSFNARYRTRVRFTDDFNVTFEENPNENVVETVDLDDDDEETPKKKQHVNTFDSKLKKIEEMADQLKMLHSKNEATSKHKRMFNKLIQRFNETYKVHYYLDDNFYLIDRNDLTGYSSSSDVEEIATTSSAPIRSKKLKNPFSILKQLSERQKEIDSLLAISESDLTTNSQYNYSEHLLQAFNENWLPSKTDFGRPEIISVDRAKETIDISKEELIFDFVKIQPEKFENWLEVKTSFYLCLQKTCEVFNDTDTEKIVTLNSLTSPKDFSNPTTVLEKLQIIKSYSERDDDEENRRVQENDDTEDDDSEEDDPTIDFDVYFRDLKNFKKSHRPTPSFYVSCLRESGKMPSTEQIARLHADLDSEGPRLLFAITGGGSISYLRVIPVQLGTCDPTAPTNTE